MQQSKFVFSRFVSEDLDDYEGRLTREGVKNFYGIVKFEIARIYTLDTNEPLTGWENIIPLQETYTFKDKLQDGMSFVSLFEILSLVWVPQCRYRRWRTICSRTIAQIVHFSFPYYFKIPISEF